MIEPFTMTRNGYALLLSLMRRSCQFMKPEPDGWVSNWQASTTLEKYVFALQVHCSVTNVKCENVYNNTQQSKEMLHYAALLYNQAIATKLDNEFRFGKVPI